MSDGGSSFEAAGESERARTRALARSNSQVASASRGGRKPLAFLIIVAPMFFSLIARAPEALGWRPCHLRAVCGEVMNGVGLLGAAFPHAIGYPVEVLAGPWVLPVLLAIDLGLAALVWRLLPDRVSRTMVAGALATWAMLSLASIWGAPYLVVWAWKL